jgi:hypothetical protein
MEYHAIYLEGDAIVRTADDGINNTEWHHGCRVLPLDITGELSITTYLKANGYAVLSRDEWNQMILDLDEDIVPSNRFISSIYIPDKWDRIQEIY